MEVYHLIFVFILSLYFYLFCFFIYFLFVPTSLGLFCSSVEPLDCAALLQFLQDDHPFSVATSDTTYEILALLRVINQFNLNWPTLYHKVSTERGKEGRSEGEKGRNNEFKI